MLSQTISEAEKETVASNAICSVAVIWIDWYAYHVGRFRGLQSAPSLTGHVQGVELVGGIGVHAGQKFRESLPSDVAVHTLMPNSSWHDVNKGKLAIKLWRQLTELDPEVVLVPGYYTLPGIAAAVWAKVFQRKSVLMTESTADDHERIWYREWFKGLLLRMLFDWAITGGKAHVRYLKQLGFREDRVAHFYDVVDTSFYREHTSQLRLQSSSNFGLPSPYFLYIGRLAPEKNVSTLIKAWISYRELGGLWPLVIVGDGPSAPELRQLAKNSAFADYLRFEGHKGSEALPMYYAFAGCFVLPSTREPWGLVVNEAMASALPVIVSSRCGCAEDLVVSGLNGFVFDPFSQTELSQRLLDIEAFGEVGRLQLGKNSSIIIDTYSPSRFGDEIARITQSES